MSNTKIPPANGLKILHALANEDVENRPASTTTENIGFEQTEAPSSTELPKCVQASNSALKSDLVKLPADLESSSLTSGDRGASSSIVSTVASSKPSTVNPAIVQPASETIGGEDADDGSDASTLVLQSTTTSLSGSISIVTEDSDGSNVSSDGLTPKKPGSVDSDATKPIVGSHRNDSPSDVNKLDVNSLGVIGRNQEISILRRCFQRLLSSDDENDSCDKQSVSQNELVFISGFSGIGKSTLAQSLQPDVASIGGIYVEGKYAFSSIDEPYSGVAQAFGDLCSKFKSCAPEVISSIGKTIRDSMHEEANMLMELIPELCIFQHSEDATTSTYYSGANAAENDHELWKFAFRMLTRILGSRFYPIVIVLDDLQWADISSLDILDCLISDVENPRPLMIIGCYRSNEVDENSMLFNRIRTLQEKCTKFGFRITDIELQNFDPDVVNKMIMTVLSSDIKSINNESKTRDLAEVCYKRTLGNPFFVIEFIKMLCTKGLLETRSGQWVWNVKQIEDETISAGNVTDLLQAPMRKLPHDMQLLLQYAACLGPSFTFSTLKFVWKNHAILILESADPDVAGILHVLEEANLLVTSRPGELEWVHDKVQGAALSLSDLVTPWFQFGLGVCLYEGLSESRLEKQLFAVVDLINKGNMTERFDLAALNLRAAKKARKMAAFQSGERYVANGIRQLPEDEMWTTSRYLTLELYSLGAEMNVTLGNIGAAEKYIRVVLDRKEYSPMETMQLRMMNVNILESVELRPADAVSYAVQTLRDIGYDFVRSKKLSPAEVLAVVMKTGKRLEKLPVDHFEKAGYMEDERQIGIVNMLSRLQIAAYNGSDIFFSFLCVCKVIELTVDHGIYVLSAASFASLGAATMITKNDHALSLHLCNIAFSIQKRFGIRNAAETIHISWGFVLCIVHPLYEALNPMLEGYSKGMREGDTKRATFNLLVRYMFLPYIMGRPLGSILNKLEKIEPQLEESKQTKVLLQLRVCWQMMINLQLRPSEAAKKLEGEKYSQSSDSFAGVPSKVATENLATGELLLFFSDHAARTKLLMGKEKGNSYTEQLKGYFVGRIETFHRGIAWFAMARQTGDRKFRSEAIKIKKQISKWSEAGDPNVKHYDLMLTAELAALDKKYDYADKMYKQAISHAVGNDHLHHAALFHERFAEYRLQMRNDRYDAMRHMDQAIWYYTEWGAVGKAEQLKNVVQKW
ncbi:unnamed protein product [Cylindrotheca closterium]|uniref:Orc1-like AAA ATPase domain-containing protein n=1 Tax=Cylindrotheca closterium TaxID=2856 RepID=A0AAD2G0B0_9STRA|nr:unnamed protein product [Cylindrotheca closterium]